VWLARGTPAIQFSHPIQYTVEVSPEIAIVQ
jgi:hypothetical protein